MGRYRICKTFTVESGHMLSKHSERCRFPHGHTRTIEVVVSAEELDDQEMVLDFKALKLALKPHVDLFDHAMAMNSDDPMAEQFTVMYPEGVVIFEGQDPTTEVIARDIFETVDKILTQGWKGSGYQIKSGRARVDRVRVWETPSSWAEYERE